MYLRSPSSEAELENNLITRNNGGINLLGNDVARAYNNVWDNGTDYSGLTAAESDISSDPMYVDPYLSNLSRLLEESPSKSGSSTGGELGAYGNGGTPVSWEPDYATTPTTAGSLTSHERWSGEVVLSGTVTVNWPWRLVIEPGTVVRAPAGAYLYVNSVASIVGTAAAPIVFEPSEGEDSWGGIHFSASAAGSVIRHAVISGANTGIRVDDAHHLINNSLISGCGTGIYVQSGVALIENNLIVENRNHGIYVYTSSQLTIRYNTIDLNAEYGLYLRSPSSEAELENNLISRNNVGVYLYGSDINRAYNNVWSNGTDYSGLTAAESDISSDPMYVDPYLSDFRLIEESPSKSGSSTGGELGAYGNGGTPVSWEPDYSTTPTTAGSLTSHERWSGEVVLSGTVTVNWPWRLVIEPGTVVRAPAGAYLYVNSVASIVGTAAAPIVFEPSEGEDSWGGIHFSASAAGSVIRHAVISGANTGIRVDDAHHLINNSLISGCGTGIYVQSGVALIENNLIVENRNHGIYVYTSSQLTIRYNTIDLNAEYGLYLRSPSSEAELENNLISRNNVGVYLYGTDFNRAYNNVWGNGTDYSRLTAAESDISSDPLYIDELLHLDPSSPSMIASASGREIGRYGGQSPIATPGLDPVDHLVAAAMQVVSGTKMAGTGIGINGALSVEIDDFTQWTSEVVLNEGGNRISVYAVDGDGNRSDAISTVITRDSIAPQLLTSNPAHCALLTMAINQVDLLIQDQGSAVDFNQAMNGSRLVGDNGGLVAGSWSNQGDHLLFTADSDLLRDNYTLILQLIDTPLGNSSTSTLNFTIDDGTQGPPAGPVFSNLLFSDAPLGDGTILMKPGFISLDADDPNGISRIEFMVDGELIGQDNNGSQHYSIFFDIEAISDGIHVLEIIGYDTLGNGSTLSFDINVSLSAPLVPVISAPASGLLTNQSRITVRGTAEKGSQVLLYSNDVQVADPVALDSYQRFTAEVELAEGMNNIQAAAENRGGLGEKSGSVQVSLDTNIPPAPANLTGQARESGVVRLIWDEVQDEEVVGYRIYRAKQSFTDAGEAAAINIEPVIGRSVDDLPGSDSTFYYRMVSVNGAGTESAVSNQFTILADATAPQALTISYAPAGAHDPVSGRMGAGMVDVTLEVSEPLQGIPFLTLTPEGGQPIPVSLNQLDDSHYAGQFAITPATVSGATYASFSGRDLVGNQGTDIVSGALITIDTLGPVITRLNLSPGSPIRNEPTPVEVLVEIEFDSVPGGTTPPQLSYLLSGPGREMQPVFINMTGERLWAGSFTLPVDGGINDPEMLEFTIEAYDDLGNPSVPLSIDHRFQVYQGELSPLATPTGFTGLALPGGQVRLSWDQIAEAADYQLLRAAPGETELMPLTRSNGLLTITDDTLVDGVYQYAIASVRQANGQETLSALSAIVEIMADSTAPPAPTELSLELTGSGIRASWQIPAGSGEVTCSLYRDGTEIDTVFGLTPVIGDLIATEALDTMPSPDDHYYTVTVIDAAGNQSQPAVSVYLNFTLLPVSNLKVIQQDQGFPELSWDPVGNGNGYNVYLLQDEQRLLLNPTVLTEPGYIDTGYTTSQRRYGVVEVDDAGVEGPMREVLLAKLGIELPAEPILRGVNNLLSYTVRNHCEQLLIGLQITARIGEHCYRSLPFTLSAAESKTVKVVFGGHVDLPDAADLITTIDKTAATGEQAQIVLTSMIEVGDGALTLELLTDRLTRGGSGQVRFSLHNTSEVDVDVVTALGGTDSDEIRFLLTDVDGNVLTVQPLHQSLGQHIAILDDGRAVAGIAPGKRFTSEPTELQVPLAAPEEVFVHLQIDRLHHRLGQDDAVNIDGMESRLSVSLIDTAYYGEIKTITPADSHGDENIVITGRAVDRATDEPMSWAQLDLVVSVNGFERVYEVVSDQDGGFSYTFEPLSAESGQYQVAAVHPDLRERPIQAQFTINRIAVSPVQYNVTMPRNYEQEILIELQASEGTVASGVHFVYEAIDQPLGALLPGLALTLPSPVDLQPGESEKLVFTVRGDETTPAVDSFVVAVKGSDSGEQTLARIRVDYVLSEALPALYLTPLHVESGVTLGGRVTEPLTLENRGLATMEGVQLALLDADGLAVPDWIFLDTPESIGDLQVGDSRPVSITMAPGDQVAEGLYEYRVQVTGVNIDPVQINLYLTVTQSGQGDVLFYLADIFTDTQDQQGNPIAGLSGARIRLQNEQVLTIDQTLTSDTSGEALFTDLPAGRYKFKATADNHQQLIGRIRIKPGITVNKEVFLDYDVVTVEWSVTEMPLEDRYEIVLTAIYETDVPAPVVVMDPMVVELPQMLTGEVYHGEFTLTNHGLIRADDLNFQLPDDDAYRIELLNGMPSSLDVQQRLTVPYRVVALKALDSSEEDGSGGGSCYVRRIPVTVYYTYQCAHGDVSSGSVTHYHYYSWGSCGGGWGGGGGGIGIGHHWWRSCCGHQWWRSCCGHGGSDDIDGGSYHGGSHPGYRPVSKPISDAMCTPPVPRKEQPHPDTAIPDVQDCTGSMVDMVMREYLDTGIDIRVKVIGGTVDIRRRYYGANWHWDHERTRLQVSYDTDSGQVFSIDRGGVLYSQYISGSDVVFINETYRILRLEEGYRWQDVRGNWEEYDQAGRMLAWGTRGGTSGRMLYLDEQSVLPSGIVDRNHNQMLWFEYDPQDNLSAVEESDGRRVEYGYSGGHLILVIDPLGGERSYQYDGSGRMSRKVDPDGRTTLITYNSEGEVASVVREDSSGTYVQYGYDDVTEERYARIESSTGRMKEVWYDESGDVKRVMVNDRTRRTVEEDGRNRITTDEKGNVTRESLDEWEDLTKIVFPDGSQASYLYEHRFHQVQRAVDQRGLVTEYSYDDQGNLVRKIEAKGTDAERQWSYTYDDDNQLLTLTLESDEQTASATTSFTYDQYGNVRTMTDPEDNTTEFLEYDAMGNPLRILDALGHEWIYLYDALGRRTAKTCPLGNSTSYEYDGAGNLVAVVDPVGNRSEFTYNARGQLASATDPYGKVRIIEYNLDGLPILVTDEEGKRVVQEFDNEQRLLRTLVGTEDEGFETLYHYDDTSASFGASNLPVQIDYPTYSARLYYDRMQRPGRITDILDEQTSHSTSVGYDAVGNRVASTDQEERTTLYSYDGLNRPVAEVDPAEEQTLFSYNDRGDLLTVTGANGGITTFEYDRNGRMITEIRPLSQTTSYEYDGMGNRTAVLDAKGQLIRYDYKSAGKLVREEHFIAADHDNPVKSVEYSYDELGQLIGYDDGITSATYSYDKLGRRIGAVVDYGSFTTGYGYTFYGNGRKQSFTGPDGETVTYGFDEANRLSSIGLPDGRSITYNGYSWNRPVRATLPGGSTLEYSYDGLQQVKSIIGKDPVGNTLLDYAYTRSASGNITEKSTGHGSHSYQYDILNRLTDAVHPVLSEENYTYDALGNRLTAAGVNGQYQYDLNNRLLSYDGKILEYDDNGNMIIQGADGSGRRFFYNVADRLVRVEEASGSLVAAYYYDPFGRRLWKEVGGAKTCFVYADEGLVAELDSQGTVIRSYGFRPDSLWTTDLLFQKVGNSYYWYQNDHLGTPQQLIDQNGIPVWQADYTAFGRAVITSAQIENNLRFPGQYFDSETGFHYNWHRYYDPNLGRYLTTDPIGITGGSNLFLYAGNRPVLNYDANGLCDVRCQIAMRAVDDFFKGVSDIIGASELFYGKPFAESDKKGHEICNMDAYGAGVYGGVFWETINPLKVIKNSNYLVKKILQGLLKKELDTFAQGLRGEEPMSDEEALRDALKNRGSFMPSHPDLRSKR